VRYTLFHGARKLERRLLSKKMPNDHWKILKDLNAAAVHPHPIDEFLPLFDERERLALLDAFQDLEIDEQSYATLFTVANYGTESITTPHDGQMLLKEYHRFLIELLENLEKLARNLRNSYNRFCKPEDLSKTTQTESSSLGDEINDVYDVLRPLGHMAWKSPLFEWYITNYLRDSIRALAVDSDDDDNDEDHHRDHDERDDDGDDEEDRSSPSGYPEAHMSFNLGKPDQQMIAKEWVYWLRLVTAPLYYSATLYVQTLSRNMPKLSFRLLTYPPSSTEMKPWKEVIKTMFPKPGVHENIIDEVIKIYGDPGGSNMISDPNFPFKGVPHCEAVLACSHYLANSKESVHQSVVSKDVLDELGKASPLIAPSKRCCPVCAAIQHELAKHSGACAKWYPIYSKHKRIYGCALPPGLPSAVRMGVIRHFEDLLREYLDELKKMSLSHCSAESAALSVTSETGEFYELPRTRKHSGRRIHGKGD
jgi:hypothetical protein